MKHRPANLSEEEERFIIEKCRLQVAESTVGFLKLSVHNNEEDADVAGSGSLISMLGQRGILTAAHVLKNLPKSGEVGIVQFAGSSTIPRKLMITIEHTSQLVLPGYCGSPHGPDLGFLKLPPQAIASLEARCTFLNLDRRRNSALSDKEKKGYYVTGVSGVIAEWATDESHHNARTKIKRLGALFGLGGLVDPASSDTGDLLDLEVSFEPGGDIPRSYGGMSGGGAWRAHFVRDADGGLSFPYCTLIGTAFYQIPNPQGTISVRAHGPKAVYQDLYRVLEGQHPST